jgi:DNA invertase Pin-like site-specific DNA recombinase
MNMAIVGYARVSTQDQDLTVQRSALNGAGVEKIFEEKESGAKGDRPQLARMLEYVREGDVLVVTKLDRMARSMVHFWSIWEELRRKGVQLRVLSMDGLDTSTPTGQLIIGILASVAQFERELILERQREGIEMAKAKGVYKGRRKALTATQAAILRSRASDPTVNRSKLAEEFGISRQTLYQYFRGVVEGR